MPNVSFQNLIFQKAVTNRNPAAVDPTIKRGVGAFGSQGTSEGLPDFKNGDFRISRMDNKDFKHAPIIKNNYQKSSTSSNLQIMHPHFRNDEAGSTALSSTNKNVKSSTNRTSVFGP